MPTRKSNLCINRFFILFIAIVLTFSSIAPIRVDAAEARASYYLSSYQVYVYPAGSGEVQVWFDVTGVNYMDDIGVLWIEIYESTDNSTWTYKKTYMHTDYSSLLVQDDIFHSGHISYQGVKGRYYKAYVCIWAGKDGSGDTRYYWTSSKKAT